MKKIKVLRIIARLNIGGPAIHTVLLTDGLDKNKFKTLLVCGSLWQDEGDMLYYAKEKNVKPYYIEELNRNLNFLQDMLALKKIYTLIKKEKPDIIHTHTAKAGTLGRLAGILYNFTHLCKSNKIRLVHTFHGHVFRGYFSNLKTNLFVLIERVLAIFTTKIITVSESVKQELIDLCICKEDKIAVVPLGLELEKFQNIDQRNEKILNIGIIGRLVPIKNHRLFLDAAAMLIQDEQNTKFRFKIIGDGELKEQLRDYAYKLKVDSYIDFLSWQKDLVKVYSDLDVVALTSINEGTPVSLIEAMAAGKIVIATDVGGVSELLGSKIQEDISPNINFKILERGIMIRSGESCGLASALKFVLQNRQFCNGIAQSGRNFVIKKFTKERLIRDMEDLYSRLLTPTY